MSRIFGSQLAGFLLGFQLICVSVLSAHKLELIELRVAPGLLAATIISAVLLVVDLIGMFSFGRTKRVHWRATGFTLLGVGFVFLFPSLLAAFPSLTVVKSLEIVSLYWFLIGLVYGLLGITLLTHEGYGYREKSLQLRRTFEVLLAMFCPLLAALSVNIMQTLLWESPKTSPGVVVFSGVVLAVTGLCCLGLKFNVSKGTSLGQVVEAMGGLLFLLAALTTATGFYGVFRSAIDPSWSNRFAGSSFQLIFSLLFLWIASEPLIRCEESCFLFPRHVKIVSSTLIALGGIGLLLTIALPLAVPFLTSAELKWKPFAVPLSTACLLSIGGICLHLWKVQAIYAVGCLLDSISSELDRILE